VSPISEPASGSKRDENLRTMKRKRRTGCQYGMIMPGFCLVSEREYMTSAGDEPLLPRPQDPPLPSSKEDYALS
jgi:hypothetical protein